jgi:hypothetical protein
MTSAGIRIAVGPNVARADIPGLCAELAGLLRGRGGGVVRCDVAGADVVTVEAVARLGLTARRHGWRLVVSGAGPDLLALVRLLGLADALPSDASAEALGQPEQREQARRVEEVVDGGDLPG